MVQFGKFSEVWERVKSKTDLTTFIQLAELVETTHQYVSRKKIKDEFPVNWAFVIAQKYGISTDWLMTGESLKDLKDRPKKRKLVIQNEIEEWLAEEVGRNPEREKWFEIQMLDSFPAFREWKRKRDEKNGNAPGILNKKVA